MPVCFQLTRLGDKEPSSFQHIDDCICQHLQVDADPIKYHMDWYDSIGMRLALGKSWDEIADDANEYYPPMLPIIAYLRENYSSDSWWQPK